MNILIPVEFEKYSNEINLLLSNINSSNKIEISFIGSAVNKENFKELYIIFNGYMNDVRININSFNESKLIYKMYPNEFLLPSNKAQVFMIYTTNKKKLLLNNNLLEHNIKINIENNLKNLLKKYKLFDSVGNKKINYVDENKYNSEISNTIKINDNEISQRIKNTTELKFIDEDFFIDINKNNLLNINTKFENYYKENNSYIFKIKLKNISTKYNFKIKEIKLYIYNSDEIIQVRYNDKILLKNMTSKIILFKINKDRIKKMNLKKIKILIK